MWTLFYSENYALTAAIDAVVTYRRKRIWSGKWTPGRSALLQAYANQYNRTLDVRTPHGSWLFDIAPEVSK